MTKAEVVNWAVRIATEEAKRVSFDVGKIRDHVRDVYMITDLDSTTAMEGLDGWLCSRSGDYALETLEALRKIKAHHAARVLERCFALLPGGRPAPTVERREDQLALVGDGARDTAFRQLGDELLRWEDGLADLLEEHVLAHASEFRLHEMQRSGN